MSLQILNKSASDFTPSSGSDLEVVSNALQCEIIKVNIKECDERYAEMSHDFGAVVKIKRLMPLAKYSYNKMPNNPNQMRIWYKMDSGSYVELDLTSGADLDVNGQVLYVKVGLKNYGYHTGLSPLVYGVDIVYEDNIPGSTPFVTADQEAIV